MIQSTFSSKRPGPTYTSHEIPASHQRPISIGWVFWLVNCRPTYLSSMKIIVIHSSLGSKDVKSRPTHRLLVCKILVRRTYLLWKRFFNQTDISLPSTIKGVSFLRNTLDHPKYFLLQENGLEQRWTLRRYHSTPTTHIDKVIFFLRKLWSDVPILSSMKMIPVRSASWTDQQQYFFPWLFERVLLRLWTFL